MRHAANLWRWPPSVTDTQGIIAIAAAAVALLALLGCARCWRSALRRAAPRPAARARRARASRTWSRTPRRMQEAFEALREYVEETALRLDGRLGGRRGGAARDDRPPRAGALRRLQRAVGPPVDVDRAARRRTLGDRAVVHPPPRPGARLRQAGARAGAANWSSRPRRPRRCALALAGGRTGAAARADAPPSGRPEMRRGERARASAISDRRARSARRRCWRARAPDAVEPVALATHLRHGRGAARAARCDWAIVPIENSLEGSISVTLDLLAERGRRRRDRRRGAAARAPLADRRASRSSWREIDTVAHAPAGARPVHALPARRAARTRASCAASSTAEAVRAVVARADGAGRRRSGRRWRPSIYGGTVMREGVQDRDDNETRFVWLARARRREPRQPPLRAPRAAQWKTSLVFWGAGAEQPGLARALPRRVRAARDQPHEDRVAPAARAARAATCSSPTWTARARGARSPRRSRACARCARRCACSAPTRPRGPRGRRDAA